MAFDIRNLSEVRALGSNRWHWNYFTSDSMATVLGVNYFSTVNGLSRLHVGDVLDIIASSGAENAQVSVNSLAGGSVTLIGQSGGGGGGGGGGSGAIDGGAPADTYAINIDGGTP